MIKTNMCKHIVAWMFILVFTCPLSAMGQQAVNVEWWVPANQVFRPEELDQMLAPIALYPDALLAQVLAAATYPHSIESADRFVKDNPRVSTQILIDVARDTDWAPSVKAMLQFPDLLAMMNQHLDWTTRLGNAFMTQQGDVMDSVQRLRWMAYEQGRLVTTREMVVRLDPRTRIISIEPANIQMIYVPVYDSQVIYGNWRYPNYPPYRYDYPGYSRSSTSSFLVGVLVGAAIGWGGWDFDWHNHRSNIRVDHYNNFVSRGYANPDRFQINASRGATIAYDTQFRRSAGYRDYTTAQSFSGRQASVATTDRPNVPRSHETQQVQTRTVAPTVSAANVRTEKPQASRTEKPQASRAEPKRDVVPQQAANPSADRASQRPDVVSKGGGSEVSQAAHAAKSEGLKGKDLAEKVHEAIDTRKENKDAAKAEVRKDEKVAKEKDATENIKKEKEPKDRGAKEKH